MIAWKFLGHGAIEPSSPVAWPVPVGGSPGAWVAAPSAGGRDVRVHGCRTEDLPYWVHEELWRVELEDPTREVGHRLQSEHGRLLARVDAWSAGTQRAFASACALRVRDLAAEALRVDGCAAEADALLCCATLAEVTSASEPLRSARLPQRSRQQVGYLGDALYWAAHAGCSSYIAAIAAAELHGGLPGADAERAWQARWLRDRLDIDAA